MMSGHHQHLQQTNQHRPHIQSKEDQEKSGRGADRALAGVAPSQAAQLPGRASQALRQAAVLQMQRVQGNNFVQRAVEVGEVESQAAAAAPNQIEGPGASVSVANGVAEVNAPMVTVNAPMVRVSGILQSDTLITNSVISSSYTPGAGNIW
jgi:hypothetical protein